MTELEVIHATVATVQDGGRPGHMHEGVPVGGALVPVLLARANRSVGNESNAAAVEIFGRLRLRARGGSVHVATDDGVSTVLAPGEELDVRPTPPFRVGYVAVRGGVDVPLVLSGRGTLLVAGFGGVAGRYLRPGDRLSVGAIGAPTETTPTSTDRLIELDAPVRVLLGPDAARFDPSAHETLTSLAFTVQAASNRMGTRLGGAVLLRRDADDTRSAPMVQGAIQVPASGEPIVLGPDHPTTGGYPVIAVVLTKDCGALAARTVGAHVRFRQVTLDEARA